MRNTAEISDSRERQALVQELLAVQVQKALVEILRSAPFRTSRQSQQLLQYIVDQTLAGHIELLKERVIGAEVFARPADYDTNEDPIVRGRAAEVRKRLAQYYMSEGKLSPVRIEISPGSYHATFSDSSASTAKEPVVAKSDPVRHQEELPSPQIHPSLPVVERVNVKAVDLHSAVWRFLGIAVLAMILAAVVWMFRPKSPAEQFWSPLLDTSKPILIYTGVNPAYLPSSSLIKRYKETHHLSDVDSQGHEFLIPLTGDVKFGEGDLLEMNDDFVTLGDVSANVDVASQLTRFNRKFDLRSGEDVAFGDLRQSPTILIGAFNNRWTLEMTGDLPFIFGTDLSIRDQSDASRKWKPVESADGNIQLDYAIVVRLPHSKTGGPLIVIAGVTQSGTRAAAEFLTSAQTLNDFLKSAPQGWKSKNMEFVLQTRVVNNIPTSPTVIANRVW
jgi:hypothetical protein